MREEPLSRCTGSSSPARMTLSSFKPGGAETSPTGFRLPRASTRCTCTSTKALTGRPCPLVADVVLAIEPVLNEEARTDTAGEHASHEGELTAAHRLLHSLHQT